MTNQCAIKFEFEKQNRQYQAGDLIKGTLVLTPSQNLDLNSVNMILEWEGTVEQRVVRSEKA
ncbi:MAG: hypothetical protein AAF902_14435, partial [Chloroflexota bacterium]